MNDSATDKPPRAAPPFSGRVGYAIAVAAVAVATLVRLALDTTLGDNYPFATYFGAVAVAAWYGHTRSSAAALVLSGFVSLYLFLSPRYTLVPAEPGVVLGLALFLAVGGVMVAMGHATRVARSRSERLRAEAVVREDELRRAEEQARQQEERLRVTLLSIGDGVITADTAGRVTNLNAVAESLTGWTTADATGQRLEAVFRIVNEGTRQPVENPAVRALTEGAIVGLANHTVLIARDGTERPIDDSAAPIRCRDGEIVGVVLVFHDITGRRRAEAELRASEDRYRTLLERIPEPLFVYDRETLGYLAVNDAAVISYGYTRDEFLGMTLNDILPAGDVPALVDLLSRSPGGFEDRGRWQHRKKDGTVFDVEITDAVPPTRFTTG